MNARVNIDIPFEFDTTNIDPYVGGAGTFEPGVYAMEITALETKENGKKDGVSTGHNLRVEYTVIEGEQKGRKYFESLNLWHASSDSAKEIAWKQLSSIAHAVGVVAGGNLGMLAYKPMLVELDMDQGTEDTVSPNTGEKIRGRKPQNRTVRRDPYQVQKAASPVPQNAPSAPVNSAPSVPTQSAPAQQAAPAEQAAPTQQSAPAASAPANGGAVPPWMKK